MTASLGRQRAALILASTGSVCALIGAIVVSQWRLSASDRAATDIAERSSPLIERLAASAAELATLSSAVTGARSLSHLSLEERAELSAAHRRWRADVEAIQSLPSAPDGSKLNVALFASLARLVDASLEALALNPPPDDDIAAVAASRRRFRSVASGVSGELIRLIQEQAEQSQTEALRIGRLRTRSARWTYLLGSLSAVLTLASAALMARGGRARQRPARIAAALVDEERA